MVSIQLLYKVFSGYHLLFAGCMHIASIYMHNANNYVYSIQEIVYVLFIYILIIQTSHVHGIHACCAPAE